MFTVLQTIQGEFQNKGSKFLSFLVPISHFDSVLLDLKAKHPKAVHFVYATRFKDKQIKESFSDDGEPKGSSGIPTLNVLRGENLLDIGIITVRYFGGTLLGVGGLVRAYTSSAQDSIQNAKNNHLFVPYEEIVEYSIIVPYALLNAVMYWVFKIGLQERGRNFGEQEVEMILSSTQEKKEKFFQICQERLGLY